MSKTYWQDRMQEQQRALTQRRIDEMDEQIKKYYRSTSKKVIQEFENTYNSILAQLDKDQEPSPALLYKLDTYWKLQATCNRELESMGDRTIKALTKQFIITFQEVYDSYALPSGAHWSTLDKGSIEQMINQIWVADGKSWSARVWDNTADLQETLNNELLHIVVAGKKGTELKQLLQERFNVSYHRANALVETEVAHIQTQAAKTRYKDAGITKVQIWADFDERRCDECGQYHKKIYDINAPLPLPLHPRCRCTIVPVIE